MIIKNFSQLATTPLRRKALLILEEGFKAAQIPNLMKGTVKKKGQVLIIKNKKINLKDYKRIFVIGAGKASSSMAYEIEKTLGRKITAGVVNDVTKGKNKLIKTNVASHPLPDKRGIKGVQKMLQLTKNLDKDDLVICLISGGGSVLMPAPPPGVSLRNLQTTNRLLIASGASIHEINIVRKHLSQVKGGQLAQHLYPAKVLTLILSDVVGDNLEVIASGLTVPDESTFKKALHVLKKYHLMTKIPHSVYTHLKLGVDRHVEETPNSKTKYFRHVSNIIIGNNKPSLEAMKKKAQKLGFKAQILSDSVSGEAATFGKRFVKRAKKRHVTIAGGETVVTVTGKGEGGRCQEMCMNALLTLPEGAVLVAAQSDGRDHSDTAGSIIDRKSKLKAELKDLDMDALIKSNDSYAFFKAIKDHITTGPTGTNVMDFYVVVRD